MSKPLIHDFQKLSPSKASNWLSCPGTLEMKHSKNKPPKKPVYFLLVLPRGGTGREICAFSSNAKRNAYANTRGDNVLTIVVARKGNTNITRMSNEDFNDWLELAEHYIDEKLG